MGRRPARRAPPAVPQAPCTGSPPTTPKGRTLATLVGGRLRAAHRPHQRRPGRRRRLRGAGHARSACTDLRARSCRRRTGPLDKLVVFVPADAGRAPVRAAMAEAGAGRDRRLRPVHVHHRRARAGSARSTGADADDRHGRRARGRRGGAGRGGAAPRPADRRRASPLLAAHPYEEPAFDVVELADPGSRAPAPAGSGPVADDHAARSSPTPSPPRCPRPRTACGSPATPTASYAGSRCAGARATSCSDRMAAEDADVYVTSDLRHHPAASSSSRTGRRWSTSPTGRPSGPGCRWSRRALTAALGATVETRVSTLVTDPWTVPPVKHRTRGAHAESRPVRPTRAARRAGPRRPRRPAAAPAGHAARAWPRSPSCEADARPGSTTRSRDARILVDDLDRRAGEGRRRRRAGQGPPRPRPQPDGPGADHQPQGPRADAARARVAGAPDLHARGRRDRGDGAARGGPGRPRLRWPPSSPPIDERLAAADRRARRQGRRDRRAAEPRSAAGAAAGRAGLPEDLLALYDKLRAAKGGVGAAAAARRAGAAAASSTLDNAELAGHQGRAGRRGDPLRGVPADPGAHRPSPGCDGSFGHHRGRRWLARQPRPRGVRRGAQGRRDR